MTTDDRPDPRDGSHGGGDARLEALLHRAGDLDQEPPAGVWDAIRAELDDPAQGRPGQTPTAEHVGEEQAARPQARGAATVGAGPHRRRRGLPRAVPLLLAAAAGAGLMYAAVELVSPDDPLTQEQVLASGDLGPVEGAGRLGAAQVLERDGRQVLRVDLDEVPDAQDGYLEVWLLRPDVSGLVTLGVLDAAQEEFVLPAGLDLGEFPVVDISREHLDGDPGHGGDSLVRGEVG